MDLINRQAAIDAIYGMHVDGENGVKNALPNTYGEDLREIIEMLDDMPSAQTDLITKIQNGIKATDADDVYSCGMRNGLRWCISLIDDKEPLYENCPSAQQWIPCSERLPEDEHRRYWICTDTGYQCECRWTNANPIWEQLTTDWHWNIFDVPQYSHVIAWMPLPEPWKGDNE